MDAFRILLFLHVLAAIMAFGPTFAAPLIAPMGRREPQYANVIVRLQAMLAQRLTLPLAISLAITGVLMIVVRGPELGRQAWLAVAVVLYVIALVISFTIMVPNSRRMIALTSTPPAGGPPPAELIATAGRLRMGGMALAGLVVAITFLMVTKPF